MRLEQSVTARFYIYCRFPRAWIQCRIEK